MISIKARNGLPNPKNKNDHKIFSASCIANRINPNRTCFCFPSRDQMIPADIPIKIYKSDQTGPKTHDGGVNDGFSIVGYHVSTPDCVASEAKYPAARQVAAMTAILYDFFISDLRPSKDK